MRGYKALHQDMRADSGDNMPFKLGKKYFTDEEIIPCLTGFHFCRNIEYLNIYYDLKNSRIFEVDAHGDIKNEDFNYVSESIQLIRELTKEEIKVYFKQNVESFISNGDAFVRSAVADQGYGLDVLISDKSAIVRKAVAEQGYGLDVLILDKDPNVRKAVARQHYGLDVLVSDEDCDVRIEVAEQHYGLPLLLCDADYEVRSAVAEQGYGLDVLINDKDWRVRLAVAKQNYGMEILVNDADRSVRAAARTAINERNKR